MTTTHPFSRSLDTLDRPDYPVAPEWQIRPGAGDKTRLRFTLPEMLAKIGSLPPQTAVLGLCDDQLPVLFDLNDPAPGPLLALADTQAGNNRLLKTIIDSLVTTNSPYEAKYVLVSAALEAWSGYERRERDGHCLTSSPTYADTTARAIIRLAEIAEQRSCGREMGAAILLVIDDLSFLPHADFDVRANFDWLLKHGPAVQIWPVVGLTITQAESMGRQTANFHTRLIGHMPADASRKLALFAGVDTNRLTAGQQYAVRIQNDWLTFNLPVEG